MLIFCVLIFSFIHGCCTLFSTNHCIKRIPGFDLYKKYCCDYVDAPRKGLSVPELLRRRYSLEETLAFQCRNKKKNKHCHLTYKCGLVDRIKWLERVLRGENMYIQEFNEAENWKFLLAKTKDIQFYPDEKGDKFANKFYWTAKTLTVTFAKGAVVTVEDADISGKRVCPIVKHATEIGCDFIMVNGTYHYACVLNTNRVAQEGGCLEKPKENEELKKRGEGTRNV